MLEEITLYSYLYVRPQDTFYCKLGVTNSLGHRQRVYNTSNLIQVNFSSVYRILRKDRYLLDSYLKKEFKYLNIIIDSGTEYYSTRVEQLIEKVLINSNFEFKKLSREDIELLHPNRNFKFVLYKQAVSYLVENQIKSLREYAFFCNFHPRLPRDPSEAYKAEFISWFKYLSIKQDFYTLFEAQAKISYFFQINPKLKFLLDACEYRFLCEKLSELDPKFPPFDFWVEFYNLKNLEEIFRI